MKRFMYEEEMERYLEEEGYNIRFGDEDLIDSTVVSEIATGLGYKVFMNKDGINEFYLAD